MPAGPTDEPTPRPKKGHVAKRLDDLWVQVRRHRGETVYDKMTGAERKIGVPDDVTTGKPVRLAMRG